MIVCSWQGARRLFELLCPNAQSKREVAFFQREVPSPAMIKHIPRLDIGSIRETLKHTAEDDFQCKLAKAFAGRGRHNSSTVSVTASVMVPGGPLVWKKSLNQNIRLLHEVLFTLLVSMYYYISSFFFKSWFHYVFSWYRCTMGHGDWIEINQRIQDHGLGSWIGRELLLRVGSYSPTAGVL